MKIKSHFGTYDLILNKNFSVSKKKKYFYIVDSFFKKKDHNFDKSNTIFIKSSEKVKTYNYSSKIIKKLLKKKIDKKSTLVCYGGGTLQDLTSFIASILFRGMDWMFVPTTLLAQSDSCIGSKIAINFEGYKNLIGGYWPPKKIFLNSNYLVSLPKKEILSGLGEMAHYYYLSNKRDFNFFDLNINKYFEIQKINYRKLIYNSLFIKKKYFYRET